MTTQMKRCILFIVGNTAVSVAFMVVLLSRFALEPQSVPDPRVWWARAILVFVAAQILFRVLAMIALAVHNAASGETEAVDREDELDRLIDLKSTALMSAAFMAFFLVAVATQAFGLSLQWFFATMTAGIVVSGLIGDAANLMLYRGGY